MVILTHYVLVSFSTDFKGESMNQEGQDILVQAEPLHEFAIELYQKAGVS